MAQAIRGIKFQIAELEMPEWLERVGWLKFGGRYDYTRKVRCYRKGIS